MRNLPTQIYSLFTAGGDFKNALDGRLSYAFAPQNTIYPYAVYSLLFAENMDTFSENLDGVSVQFNLFSEQSSASECYDLADKCCQMFDGKPINANKNILIRRIQTPPFRTDTDDMACWQAVIEFGIIYEE